ncbi:MAG: MFS transporter [Ignavibacteriales bacterium CG_4_9_14_3_um_filter_34_10]|nr:MAG: MFS transporter [Ignavibacteriales bacterium CG_4_9_14_3_um_filter_34_10]
MNLSASLNKIKSGFESSFWTANIMELFERLAYYGQATILSIFLRDHLKFNEVEAGQLSSVFGGLIYLLPIFAGAIADKIGFRKAFTIAFSVLAVGYFLIGASGMKIFSGFYSNFPMFWLLIIILIFTAMGGSFIKPSVLGTVALSSTDETKSLGYAIYYWLVNIGAAIGPLFAFLVRDNFGIEFVYLVSAISCALMFGATLFFYKEPKLKIKEDSKSILSILIDLFTVLKNFRFITFLLIFALYWLIFWQFFIVIPFYINDFVSPDSPIELIISTGAWTILFFQIPINRLTKGISTPNAILIGFAMAAISWLFLFVMLPIVHGQIWNGFHLSNVVIVTGIFLFSIGEQTQAPRFYEYIATLAPKGQEALFQGYAFLPIAIAWGLGGTLGGWLYQNYAKTANEPTYVFAALFFIGALATALIFLYNFLTKKK